MLFVKVYLLIALPILAAIFLVYLHFFTKRRLQRLKAEKLNNFSQVAEKKIKREKVIKQK